MQPSDPGQLRSVQLIALGLIAGPLLFLGVGLLLRLTGSPIGNIPALSYVAVAVALLSPMVAGAVRARTASPAAPPSPQQWRRGVILPLAILEAAATVCAMAFLVAPTYWPLAAAAIPLATMLAWFPRAG
jgi:hypothetical protein